jgi:hypothetical protein
MFGRLFSDGHDWEKLAPAGANWCHETFLRHCRECGRWQSGWYGEDSCRWYWDDCSEPPVDIKLIPYEEWKRRSRAELLKEDEHEVWGELREANRRSA